MKATNNSINIMKTLNINGIILVEYPKTMLWFPKMNIIHTKDNMITCPAVILAKSRTVKENGLVNISMNSNAGIKGTGSFNQVGTSGFIVCFQNAFVLDACVMTKVNNAKVSVTAMLPVMLAPPGKNGNNPIMLHKNIKVNTLNR